MSRRISRWHLLMAISCRKRMKERRKERENEERETEKENDFLGIKKKRAKKKNE